MEYDTISTEFPDEGVVVTIPVQQPQVSVRTTTAGEQDEKRVFIPQRRVINIELFREDDPEQPLKDFGVEVGLQVNYMAEDVANAKKEGGELALGYWDGSSWICFAEKHNFELHPAENPADGGFATLTFTTWGDPPIHWGGRVINAIGG